MRRDIAIHIFGTAAMEELLCDINRADSALIACVELPESANDLPHCLRLSFADVSDARRPRAFDSACARRIVDFTGSLPDTVTDLFVCCSAGQSRSPAIAAALLRASGRSDRDVWLNPYYSPNRLVYRVLMKELGLFMPGPVVYLKKLANRLSFRHAKRTGSAGRYERWQILF